MAAAIDGSHISIKCPPGGPEAMKQYHNFKNFYSVVLLALVEAKYLFIWTALGAPGNTHYSRYLFHKIKKGNVLPENFQFTGNTKIPSMILGDGAFPLNPWICKPFGDAVLTGKICYFNYRFNHAHILSEGAFGKFKSQFRVFHRKCESSKESVKTTDLTAVVLHNICLEMEDTLVRSMELTVDLSSSKRRDREEVAAILDLINRNQKNYTGDKIATAIR